MNDYLEIKLHKNKPAQQFNCTLLQRAPGCAVLRYVSQEPGNIAGMRIEPGSTTVAHYWTERPYVAWRMFGRKGCLLGTLFHICADVRIHDDHLSYEDLLLDIWVAPDGSLRVLDEDELRAWADAGMVSAEELHHVRKTQHDICARHGEIIAGLAAFERAQGGIAPPAFA